jgi:thioredoxin-related protein
MRFFIGLILALSLASVVAAAETAVLGDDGLYKISWQRTTFKDLSEDLAEANAEGKNLMLIFEQRGCPYCKEMHEKVFSDPEVEAYIRNHYFVIQLNLYGSEDVTDFDGEVLIESKIARKWGIFFTPTMLFLPPEVSDGDTAIQASVAMLPGAMAKGTTLDMFTWVAEKRYLDQEVEDFQRYHARRIVERDDGIFD